MPNIEAPPEENRRKLYDIIHSDAPFDEKAERALELGRQYLGADNGHLTRIDPGTNHWKAIISTDPPDGDFPEGLELDLSTTYCRRVIEEQSPVALSDAPTQGWDSDPAFETHELHCYHGTALVVDNDLYGTLCFVSESPREEEFTADETAFAELIARLLERELERTEHEAELTRRTNLINVLNRVLRHNLRNDMSVIRGYTQLMAEELPGDSKSEVVLETIDDLIDLSDKARELERITTQEFEKQSIDLVPVVAEIINDVEREFPNTTVEFDHPDELVVAVLPSYHRVVEELLENAAKHGEPPVEVSLQQHSNAVELQVGDAGPGLSDQELAVLNSGTETPLIHGSGLGLWTVHWIVTTHGGSVDVTTDTEGTTMTVTIPRAPLTEAYETVTEVLRARDRYQAAFEESSDAMVIIDDDARIIAANSAASSLYEVTRQDLLGREIPQFLPDDFDFESAWERFQNEGELRDTVTIETAGGTERIVEYSAVTDIVPQQHLVISRDVTDQVRREEELSRKTQAIEDAPVGITITDPDQDDNPIIFANDKFIKLTGYDREEVIGRNCRFLQGEDTDPNAVREMAQAIDEANPVTVTLRNYRKDGTPFMNRVSIAPIRDEVGNVTNYVGFQEEISDQQSEAQ